MPATAADELADKGQELFDDSRFLITHASHFSDR
jgi:hypothetical protein